jgi:hypothetical protein
MILQLIPLDSTIYKLLYGLINNNNQLFYSQASWGRLKMESHEPKNRYKIRVKKEKIKGDKKTKSKKEKRH